MRLRPGSLPWLLSYDLALNWRRFMEMFARLSPWATWSTLIGGAIVMHLVAWPVAAWLVHVLQESSAASTSTVAVLACSVLAWMVAQGLLGMARSLQERGSGDLLFSSPLPVRVVLASRAATLAASSFGSVGLLVLPVANMCALLDGPSWLVAYPALFAQCLMGTTAGFAAAIGLFLAFEARRARMVAQLCAALAGGAFLLGAQIVAMLPEAMRAAVTERIAVSKVVALLDTALLGWICAAAVLLLAGAVALLSDGFLRASLRAAGGSAGTHARRPPRRRFSQFGSGLGATLRRKEWRLLRRDHGVFAQLSLQIVYTVPLAVVLMRGVDNLPLALAVAPAIVVIAAQVTASLAWITVSGEDAPELIAAAPVPRERVEMAKITAIGLPVLIILALPLAGLALLSPFAAVMVALFAGAASISTALLNLWHPMPGNRRGMLRRHSQSKVMALLEHLLAMLWAIAIVLAVVGSAWALLPIAMANMVLFFCSPQERKPWRTARSAVATPGPQLPDTAR
jgi:ABC-2 type transport system permease protein